MLLLESLEPSKKVDAPKGWRPAIEIDGETGWAVTPGIPADEKPDFDQFLIDAGFDPAEIEVVGTPRTSRWQRYDGSWLTSYRFNFRRITADADLKLLWSTAKRNVKKPVEKKLNTDKTFVIAVSDFQLGKVDHRGGKAEALARIFETYDRIEARLKKEKYEHVIISDIGDIVEGFTSKADTQQTFTNDLSIMDQVDLGISLIWDLVKRASKHTNKIWFASIASNHCQFRINKQQVGAPGRDDWGVMIAKQIHRLAQETELPITVHIPQEHDESLAIDVFGDGYHVLGLVHGHQAARPDAVPNWWRSQAFGQQPVAGATILLTGHFHHLRVQELGQSHNGGSRFWVQVCTMDGGSNWWRLNTGEDSQTGIVCFELQRGIPFTGTVWKV
jgi:hypothetical protein